MKDSMIEKEIDAIKEHISVINQKMASLHNTGVEVRISFKDNTSGAPNGIPCIELWRATEHVDYLK